LCTSKVFLAKKTHTNRALLQERRSILGSLTSVCLHIVGLVVLWGCNESTVSFTKETYTNMALSAREKWYGVATISRLLEIIGLVCRIASLL